MLAQLLSWRSCSQGQRHALSGAALLMERGKIKDLHPLASKCYHFLPSALATGIWLAVCLYLWGPVKPTHGNGFLTSETDVICGRAGTVFWQPLSCLRHCSLKWIRKCLIGILRETRCIPVRADVYPDHTFKWLEKLSHKRWYREGALSQWQSYNKLYLAAICQVNFKPVWRETSEISEQ